MTLMSGEADTNYEAATARHAAYHARYFGPRSTGEYVSNEVLRELERLNRVRASAKASLEAGTSPQLLHVDSGEPGAYGDGGWVAVLEQRTGTHEPRMEPRARAHLFLDSRGAGADPRWEGHLASVHLMDDSVPLEPGCYILQFEQGGAQRHVALSRSASGISTVAGSDGLVPPAMDDVSEGGSS
jgi:hypothetical protein